MDISSFITSTEHAFAIGVQKIIAAARFVETEVRPALIAAQANAATIEAITGLVSPQAANLERLGACLIALAIKIIDDSEAAGTANGVNITLDAALIADLKSVASAVKSQAPPTSHA